MTATLAPPKTGIPEDYADLLALYPWIKVQPHQWDGKTEAERLGLVVAAARATVDMEEARLQTLQQQLRAGESELTMLGGTPVFRVVPGNIPGTHDLMYEDTTTSWDGKARTQPYRIVNPKTLAQGRAILAQMESYDALKKERDDLAAQVEQLTKPKKK